MNALPAPEFHNALMALQYHAEHQGDAIAYKTLDSFGKATEEITYQTLSNRSHSIARYIHSQCEPGARVILLYDNSIEMICALLACMMSNTIGIPCAPLKGLLTPQSISMVRLQSIAHNANSSLILTTAQHTERLKTYSTHHSPIKDQYKKNIQIVDTATIPTTSHTITMTLHSIAYLQYTSGTTGTAKGVIISHENASNNINNLIKWVKTTGRQHLQTAVNWLPHHHDMGLINAILIPLYAGCLSVILSPFSFLKRPDTWLKTISQYPGVISGAPCFAFAHCCQHITAEKCKDLDLSSWSLAFVGSDAVRIEQLHQFINAFKTCHFDPTIFHACYGLAEATVHASGDWRMQGLESHNFDTKALQHGNANITEQSNKTLIAHGTSFPDHTLHIVDTTTQKILPEKCVGEIWITGPSVASGYWNQPTLSAKTFHNTLEGDPENYLRTGDAGFIMEGQLYITGRMKDTLIIRGQNMSPDDIEWVVMQASPELQHGQVVAFAIEHEQEEALIVLIHHPRYPEEQQDTLLASSRTAILHQLGIQTQCIGLVKSPAFPTTTSGKINRLACKHQYLKQDFNIINRSTN